MIEGLISLNIIEKCDSVCVSYKRTRRGKIRKQVRPVYFRDDLSCGVVGCSACAEKDTVTQQPALGTTRPILVPDAETAMSQTDFICNDSCVSNCVLTYTALNALQQTNRNRADKLRSLCKKQERPFFAFPNEFHQETFVPFPSTSTAADDRSFNATLATAKWYAAHLALPVSSVIILTCSEKRRDGAREVGLSAMTVWEYSDSVRTEFPLAGESLASPSDVSAVEGEMVYPPHLSTTQITEGIQQGRFQQGVLRMAMGTCSRGTVSGIEIVGKMDLNRALDGDIVAIEIFPEAVVPVTPVMDDEDADPAAMSAAVTESATDVMAERLLMEDEESGVPGGTRGRVLGIMKRNWKEYSGTLRSEGDEDEHRQDRMFVPADARVPFIRIRTRNAKELIGKRIVVVIDSWDRTSKSPSGHWVAILGKAGDRDTESDVILREHHVITRPFSKDVMACLPPSNYKPGAEDITNRLDLRSIPLCSIDPPGCKDIDDALSCQILPNGNFQVGVHIADVTHFVQPGSAIDLEAAERCTTVYLVEKRTDMLPGLLTADLCSLREKVDRLCFSVIWEMTKDGEIVNTEFHKAIINSRASLTYAAAQGMIDDSKDQSDLTKSIRNLNMLAKKIRQARMDRGALELASQEVRFELDSETQDPTDVAVYQSRDTNKLVEEFMVLANQAVARQILAHFPSTSVLRRHPPPKEAHLDALKEILEKQGFHDFKYGTNKELAESLSKVQRKRDPFFNRLVRVMTTRCMNQATYFCTGDVDPGSFWHYGLAMDLYTHFTSPIRRYADVLVHRLLSASLGISKLPESLQTKTLIHNQCDTMNIKHKMAQLAGRASSELHIYLFFKKFGNVECDTIVTRIRLTKRGHIALHVLSSKYGVEGVVTIPSGWSFDSPTETATMVNEGTQISVFDHVMVKITADDSNFRFRTLFEFIRKTADSEIGMETKAGDSKKIEKQMFPDRAPADAPVN